MNTFYRRTQISRGIAFAAALTAICGKRVRVVTGRSARTDGDTVFIPPPTDFHDIESQGAVYGIGCHEAAHIFYNTPVHMQSFVAEFDETDQHLARLCYNAAIDCADETRFEIRFPLSKMYFTAST